MDFQKVINHRVADVPPSGIRKFFDIVKQMPDASLWASASRIS